MKPRTLLIYAFILSSSHVLSSPRILIDTCSFGKSFGVDTHWGVLVPHQELLKPLQKGVIKSIELSYKLNRNKDKLWYSFYNHPEVGISYMFMDLGYSNVLGYSHSLYPYINFSISPKDKLVWVSLRFASGISYVTKVYDSISNKQNLAISSYLNLFAQLGVKFNFKIENRTEANVGLNGIHISNGVIKKPNYGLNIATMSCGVNFYFGECYSNPKSIITPDITNNRWSIIFAGAVKETGKPGGLRYGVGSLGLEYSRVTKTLLRIGTSLDYMYDGATFRRFEQESVQYKSRLKASKVGLTFMGEMSLDRLSAFANFGVYLYNFDKKDDPVYQRIGVRYRFNKIFYGQISLKTHLNVADYLEYGVILAIPSKKERPSI